MTVDIYDFDGTLYPGDSATAYWLYCLRRQPKILKHLPRQIGGVLRFFCKKCTLSEMKETFFCFVRSINAERLAEEFWAKHRKKIFPWFQPQKNDAVTVVCSASPEFEILPVLRAMGVQYVIATQIDPKTGRLLGENCKGAQKVERLRAALGDCEYRRAYSDNIRTDAPMLSLAKERYQIKKGNIIPIGDPADDHRS